MDSNYFRLGSFTIGTLTQVVTTTNSTHTQIWIRPLSLPDPDPGRYWAGKPRFGGL